VSNFSCKNSITEKLKVNLGLKAFSGEIKEILIITAPECYLSTSSFAESDGVRKVN
jgi:hypothetical protein